MKCSASAGAIRCQQSPGLRKPVYQQHRGHRHQRSVGNISVLLTAILFVVKPSNTLVAESPVFAFLILLEPLRNAAISKSAVLSRKPRDALIKMSDEKIKRKHNDDEHRGHNSIPLFVSCRLIHQAERLPLLIWFPCLYLRISMLSPVWRGLEELGCCQETAPSPAIKLDSIGPFHVCLLNKTQTQDHG